jgi:hypothetical protein
MSEAAVVGGNALSRLVEEAAVSEGVQLFPRLYMNIPLALQRAF